MLNNERPEDFRLDPPRRKLSPFVAQEFLYEYTQDRLSEERRRALETQLETNDELRAELKLYKQADDYVKNLAKTRISPLHLEDLNQVRPLRQVVYEKLKWRSWSEPMKWATEALAVSVMIAVIAIYLPWDRLNLKFPQRSADVTLAEVDNAVTTEETAATAPSTPASNATPVTQTPAVGDTKTTVIATSTPQGEPSAPATVNQESVVTADATTPGLKGELFNMMMNIEITEPIANAIRQKILGAGGAKAGQVELGWHKKNPDGRYYHFSFPQAHYQDLVNFLSDYGRVRIYKNQHQRMMPEGQIRIILWVEDTAGGAQQSSDQESPQ